MKNYSNRNGRENRNRKPVEGSGSERENAGGYRDIGHEVADSAVDFSEGPIVVQHVNEVEETVEDGQKQVR